VQKPYAELLEAAGVDTFPELAQRVPGHFLPALAAVNGKQNLVRKLPTSEQVAEWVQQTKSLPRVVTY
jgi:hypothetical protein